MVGKQAKILSDAQLNRVLREVEISRHPDRDRVMVLLSHKAGLRAKEISGLTWDMITDADGNIGAEIALRNKASKGKNGGRHIPLNPDLRSALVALAAKYDGKPRSTAASPIVAKTSGCPQAASPFGFIASTRAWVCAAPARTAADGHS